MSHSLETLDWRTIKSARWVQMPNGYGLWIAENAAGGRTYTSDEVGGGVVVWDTALVSVSSLLFALALEFELDRLSQSR